MKMNKLSFDNRLVKDAELGYSYWVCTTHADTVTTVMMYVGTHTCSAHSSGVQASRELRCAKV